MAVAAYEDAPDGGRVLEPAEWADYRFGWLESVRRDQALSAQAQLLAHVLALDFANKYTAQCDPSIRQLQDVTGRSKNTVLRALKELRDGGWMVAATARGRSRTNGYGFVTKGQVVRLKGAKSGTVKGATDGTFSRSEKVPNLQRKGAKSATAYNIAKPCKNHGAREAHADGRESDDVLAFWAEQIMAGKYIPQTAITAGMVRRMLGRGLVTKEALKASGIENF